MPIVTLSNIEKTFGRRVLFDKLDFIIDRGERVGLIGDNGAGKTTLFKAMMGQMTPDAGSIAIAKTIKVGYLSQDPQFDETNSVIDEAELAFAQLHTLSHQMRDLEHEMAHVVGDELDRVLKKYQDIQHEFDIGGGYAWRHRLEATLLGVGLLENTWEQNVKTLSGGQRSRLALAKVLISEPDLLLLDEPTNHLDLEAVQWLEKYLMEFTGAVLIISHDRYLLDRLATRIVWLTRAQLRSYPGNYSSFVAQREMQELAQQRAYEEQRADIAKQQEFIRRFGAGQRSKEAKGREKRLNRLLVSDAIIQAVDVGKQIHVGLKTDQRAGDQVLQVRELSKAYDTRVLWKNIAFDVKRGERIGIIGPNGSGKTTLLEVLLRQKEADAGDIRWGANLKIGYYDQRLDDFDPNATVFDETRGDREVKDQEVRGVLALMLFRGEDIDKMMSDLSGGERARVAMAQLLLDKPNVIILDEPTNHLDIPSSEALENALKQFEGTTLCVSHDRYFLDKTVSRLLVLRPPEMDDFEGNYTAWMQKRQAKADEARLKKAEETRGKDSNKNKNKYAQGKPASNQGGGNSASNQASSVKQSGGSANSGTAKSGGSSTGNGFKPSASGNSGGGGNAGASNNANSKPAKKDNPYSRPFGRLTVEELERQIADSEAAVQSAQTALGDPALFKDVARGKKLQADLEAATKKLEQLEAEYYARSK
jgi:ATP-binding cassette subfamily F protein 3